MFDRWNSPEQIVFDIVAGLLIFWWAGYKENREQKRPNQVNKPEPKKHNVRFK